MDFEAHDNRLHCKKLLLMNINELTGFPSQTKNIVLCKITFDCLSLNCKLESGSTLQIGFLLLKLKITSILVTVVLLEAFLFAYSLIIILFIHSIKMLVCLWSSILPFRVYLAILIAAWEHPSCER